MIPRLIFPAIDANDINKYLRVRLYDERLNTLVNKINAENPLFFQLIITIHKSNYFQGDIDKIKLIMIHLIDFMQYFHAEEELLRIKKTSLIGVRKMMLI